MCYGSSLLNSLVLDTGKGNDKVYLGDDAARTGGWAPSVCFGNVEVGLGSGDDELYIGYLSVDGTASLVLLGDRITLDGGAGGNDTLTIGDWQDE